MTTYAHVVNGTIDQTSNRPTELRRLDNGATVLWSPYITPAELAACGWFSVAVVARPTDTASATYDYSIGLVNGSPSDVWTQRPKTQAELDADRDNTNAATIRQQANNALDNNRTYLAIASPTNAQVLAQVRSLTQQMNGVIRLVLGKLDGTN